MRTQIPFPKGAQFPQFSANVLCGQTTGWTKMALGIEVGLGPDDFVFDRDPATLRTQGTPTTTQFLAHVYCGQTAGWIKMVLGMEVGLVPGHIVLDGEPVPLPPKGGRAPPQFSVHFYCRQTALWIKMALGMEVGLSPRDFVKMGTQPRSQKGGGAPNFRPCLLWPNGCMDQDGTWHGGRSWFSPHCARGRHSSPPHLTQSRLGRGRAPYQVAF